MRNRNLVIFIVIGFIALTLKLAAADTFSYQDDFETDKAMYDSWQHSAFVDTVPDIRLCGCLHYENGLSGRGLGFYTGSEVVCGSAYLTYITIPEKAFTSGGSVEFYHCGQGGMSIGGSTNGLDWSLLGDVDSGEYWEYFCLQINEGDPAYFLRFSGWETTIDDLQITIDYVPPNLLLSVPNGGESLVSGSMYTISWESQGLIDNVTIDFSSDYGSAWVAVDPPNTGNTGTYNWLAPVVDSNQCLVRISDANDPNISDTSDEVFTIFQCQGPIVGDLNSDCYVDFKDFAILAVAWLDCGNPFDPACWEQ